MSGGIWAIFLHTSENRTTEICKSKDPAYIFFFLLAFITDVKGQGHITKEKRLIDLFGFCHLRDTESFFLI